MKPPLHITHRPVFFVDITFLLLGIGHLTINPHILQAGGYVGIIAAFFAYYVATSALYAAEGMPFSLPVRLSPSTATNVRSSLLSRTTKVSLNVCLGRRKVNPVVHTIGMKRMARMRGWVSRGQSKSQGRGRQG